MQNIDNGGLDIEKMERRIRYIAKAWAPTVAQDQQLDFADLLQDLRLRYWEYWRNNKSDPHWNTIRTWVWGIMRNQYGYVGSSHSILRSEPPLIRVGEMGIGDDADIDVNDEEILDYMAFHRSAKLRRTWMPEE